MNIEAASLTALLASPTITALCGTRIYPVIMPDDCLYPAVTYQRISEIPDYSLDGPGTFNEVRLQLDAWALTYGDTRAITDAIRITITVFSFGTFSSGTIAYTVAEIKTLQFSGGKLDLEDVTNMDSPGAFREKTETLLDGGDLSLSGNYVSGDAGRIAFNTAYLGRTLVACKVVLPLAAG